MSILLNYAEDYAILTLNRPEQRNALDLTLLNELSHALDDIEMMGPRGIVLIGAGNRAFCAGADVGELQRRPPIERQAYMKGNRQTLNRITTLGIPSVAVIHGFAFGGGLELALSCTFRLATPNASLGLPEIRLGLIPGYGGTQRLPRLIGPSRALELMLSGGTLDAERALTYGLVSQIISDDDLARAGLAFLRPMTAHSASAGRAILEAVDRGMALPFEQALALEADQLSLVLATPDAEEGMQAFLEKRSPNFAISQRPAIGSL